MRGRGWSARFLAVMTTLAMLLAPLIISATHGPGAVIATIEAAAETAAHGHSHDGGARFPGHDATDHDHQHAAILPPARVTQDRVDREGTRRRVIDAEGTAIDGPLRPPRA